MVKAYHAEGGNLNAIRGGSMETVHVKSVNSPPGGKHGHPADPCDDYCQPLLRALGITW